MGKSKRCMEPGFNPSEIRHMESLLSEKKTGFPDRSFYQQVTKGFNRSSGRVGSEVIQVNEVQEWFENKLKKQGTEITNLPLDSMENNVAETSSQITIDEKEKIPDLDELEFEAKSQRDFAWYDVSKFVSNRVLKSGEVEVKVRYENFGEEEDEWVNVKKCVRVRSVPLESSECNKVHVGDLVLCFREKNKEALHFDARVVEVERKLHDMRGCRCQFLVRYDHDQTQEKVNLSRLCGRPPWASSKALQD
ncbi:hypothetical protein LUZ60_013597 [Juncus effusus]|nr:hypothetical protein LUZ60_013597 [Juncus effusus]